MLHETKVLWLFPISIPNKGDPRKQYGRTASNHDYIVVVFGHLCRPVEDLNKNTAPLL